MEVPVKLLTSALLWAVVAAHAAFVVGELYKWGDPLILQRQALALGFPSAKAALPAAMIVHNAGLYNAFLTIGLIWSILAVRNAFQLRIFFLSCAIVAGIFGTLTLATPIPLIAQTGLGGLAMLSVIWSGRTVSTPTEARSARA
jgi:putative membrane protein